jgi:hypothetical protein
MPPERYRATCQSPTDPWIVSCLWVSGKGKKDQKRRIKEIRNKEIKK